MYIGGLILVMVLGHYGIRVIGTSHLLTVEAASRVVVSLTLEVQNRFIFNDMGMTNFG